MFCKNCGNQISEDSLFCAKCGTKIEAAKNVEPAGEKTVASLDAGGKAENYSKSKPSRKTILTIVVVLVILVVAGIIYQMVAPSKEQLAQEDFITMNDSGGGTIIHREDFENGKISESIVDSEEFQQKAKDAKWGFYALSSEQIGDCKGWDFPQDLWVNLFGADHTKDDNLSRVVEIGRGIKVPMSEVLKWWNPSLRTSKTVTSSSAGSSSDSDKAAEIVADSSEVTSESSAISNNDNSAPSAPLGGYYAINLINMNFAQIYDLMPTVFKGKVTFEENFKVGEDGPDEVNLWVYVDGNPAIEFCTYDADKDNSERHISYITILAPDMAIPLNDDFKSDATIADIEKFATTTDLQVDVNKSDDGTTSAKISYGINEYAIEFDYTYNSHAMQVYLFTGKF